MYTFTIKSINKEVEVRPMINTITCYYTCDTRNIRSLHECYKNGETIASPTKTNDRPEEHYFSNFCNIKNISSTLWMFKECTNSEQRFIIYSDLSKEEILAELVLIKDLLV